MFNRFMAYMRSRGVADDLFQAPLLDYRKLWPLARANAGAYAAADPFPHIVLDDFLDQRVLQAVIRSFPSKDQLDWMKRDAKFDGDRDAQIHKLDFALGRRNIDDELKLSAALRYTLLELNSATFLRFLQMLTGIESLLADPGMFGGGLHQSLPGGVLAVHSDFPQHPQYGLDRRLNVLLFLNEDWRPEYGGSLELWSPDMGNKVKEIVPIANRCLIFSTSAHSYHGFTVPVACPPGRTRKSIAMYYYTMPASVQQPAAAITSWQRTR